MYDLQLLALEKFMCVMHMYNVLNTTKSYHDFSARNR